ncbi:MAG: sulfotransferase [Scytonematopsis contorta HA4267-MV1]|jgi:hypothetical protein|nr:sulfotransferase [Scytonematopsis contorta HA4267-MV1]
MSTQVLNIKKKNRTPASLIASLKDFDYELGETIDSKIILDNTNISLYCLDYENRQTIFVETPVDVDIYKPAFLYQAQYEYAQRLFAVPYDDFHKLAADIEDSLGSIIMIYSVGRCGSTLLSKIFNQVDTILSLSEPDIFSQMVFLRKPDGSNDSEIVQLVKSSICMLAKANVEGKSSFSVIKLRSFGIEIADLIYRAFPHAKLLFMYRNAENVVKSSIRAFIYFSEILPIIKQNIELYSQATPLLKEYASYIDFTDSNATDLYTIMWLSVMQRYLLLCQKGIPILAFRYEDLIVEKQQIVTAIFNYCGLPISEVANGCKAFEKDSQSGSDLSRENTSKNDRELDMLEISQKINALLQKHPQIKISDFIAPNTLTIDK